MSPKTRALTAFGVAFVAAAGALALAGCGGGGGGSSSSGSGTSGDVAVSVTDAPVDAIETFDCRVTAITLTRQDGLVVSALPAAQRIDFADDVSVRELVAAATIPRGIYTGLSVTLDLATPTADPDGVVARLVGQ
ncbi:MAG TPA: hypothetical protein VHF22_01280, partial [Planctomycetota bacterium]|nr:hypothetical protein [Planctomycetota bacterium]